VTDQEPRPRRLFQVRQASKKHVAPVLVAAERLLELGHLVGEPAALALELGAAL
jgi:hypothetical protein